MKKLSGFKTLLLLFFILIFIFIILVYRFKKLDANEEIFRDKFSTQDEFIGVIDDKYYKIDNGKFVAKDSTGELFSIYVLDVKQILYDNLIYIFEKNGNIRSIDRNNGSEIKSFNLGENIEFAKFYNDDILIYSENSAYIMDKKLEILSKIEDLDNPINIDVDSEKKAIIEFKNLNNTFYSNFIYINDDEIVFELSTNTETYLFTKIIGNKVILVSSSYIYLIENNTITKKILIEDISALDFNENNLAIVNDGNLIIYDENLNEISRKDLEEDADKLYIRNSSIVIVGEKNLMVFENDNLIKTPIQNVIGSFSNSQASYIIFKDRIEKVNAY